jgi:thiol-disulfide isomerase/thioredoxin
VSSADRPLTLSDSRPPRRAPYLVAALVLVIVATVAVAVATHTTADRIAGTEGLTNLGPAPALTGGPWINSKALTPADLKGKVVLYDFWTYSCVNCVRTLPYLESWYRRYQPNGLVVVGIHSPEFQFEHDTKNVEHAVKDLHVDYPVVQDNDLANWSAFNNNYWPADYLADRTDEVRAMHIGEGGYSGTENLIRELLHVTKTSPRATSPKLPREGNTPTSPTEVTAETYLGTDRGATNVTPGTRSYPTTAGENLGDGGAAAIGKWTATAQYLRSGTKGSTIDLRYHAREVNLVLATDHGKPVDLEIAVDGRPLAANERTSETFERAGETYIRVQTSDLYRIVLGPSVASHELTLVAQGPGLRAYAFTFGA